MEVKEAIRVAKKYVEDVYAEADICDVMLEEVKLSDDGQYWYVTIGFTRPALQRTEPVPSQNENFENLREFRRLLAGRPLERDYKLVKVSDETGQVESMEIRSFLSAS